MRLRLLKNAIANVLRGGTGALAAVLLPAQLVRSLHKDECNVWFIILNLSAYAALLEFGLQTAIGRFVAQADERGEAKRCDSVVSTGVAMLAIGSVIGLVAIGVLAW